LNQVWRLEGSSSLTNWLLVTMATNTTGWVEFRDPEVNPNDFIPPHRFYRIGTP
jgi:hypothetical protein